MGIFSGNFQKKNFFIHFFQIFEKFKFDLKFEFRRVFSEIRHLFWGQPLILKKLGLTLKKIEIFQKIRIS